MDVRIHSLACGYPVVPDLYQREMGCGSCPVSLPSATELWPWKMKNKKEPSWVWRQEPQKFVAKGIHPWEQNQNVIIELPLTGKGSSQQPPGKTLLFKDLDCYETHIFSLNLGSNAMSLPMEKHSGITVMGKSGGIHRQWWQVTFYSVLGTLHCLNSHSELKNLLP